MYNKLISDIKPLGFTWETIDPFLLCVHHLDHYPEENDEPHRGFETITVVLEGYVGHSDSHAAAGRYGNGDVQWMTAGAGLQHAEIFPLLNKEKTNPLELFQIWLNLPEAKKMCKPYYEMLWTEDIPVHREKDTNGKLTEVTIVAGELGDMKARRTWDSVLPIVKHNFRN